MLSQSVSTVAFERIENSMALKLNLHFRLFLKIINEKCVFIQSGFFGWF